MRGERLAGTSARGRRMAERLTKVQRDNVQCTKEVKGGEGKGRGERKVKTKTLPVREALLQELL